MCKWIWDGSGTEGDCVEDERIVWNVLIGIDCVTCELVGTVCGNGVEDKTCVVFDDSTSISFFFEALTGSIFKY